MPYKVLLIDDDPDLLPSMVVLLTELTDFTVVSARNGLEGLEKAISEQPDCLVVDVRMPELNGYQLVQVLRGDPATVHLPLIMLTALVQDRDQYIGLAVGADRYLTKPVDAMDLIDAINTAIHRGVEDRYQQMLDLDEQAIPERSSTSNIKGA